jgi:cell division transport system permease protein
MIGFRFASAARGLPRGPDRAARFLPWALALMVYLAGLGGVGLITIGDVLSASGQALATTLTLQVPAEASQARLDTVLALLRQTPGIASVHLLEPAETALLLEPWLGPAPPLDELPVPRLVDVQRDPKGGLDLAALRTQLATVVPEARLDDQPPWPKGMRAAAHHVEGILAAGIVVALLLVAASAVFALRTALNADRSAAGLLHTLGAGDADIARLFAVRALLPALMGGVIGATAVLLTIVALGDIGALVQLPAPSGALVQLPAPSGTANGVGGGIGANRIADWRVWAVVIGAALAAVLIAMASVWAATMRRLALMP